MQAARPSSDLSKLLIPPPSPLLFNPVWFYHPPSGNRGLGVPAVYPIDPVSLNVPQDHGFMYSHGFQDLDGHFWERVWMDPAAIQKG